MLAGVGGRSDAPFLRALMSFDDAAFCAAQMVLSYLVSLYSRTRSQKLLKVPSSRVNAGLKPLGELLDGRPDVGLRDGGPLSLQRLLERLDAPVSLLPNARLQHAPHRVVHRVEVGACRRPQVGPPELRDVALEEGLRRLRDLGGDLEGGVAGRAVLLERPLPFAEVPLRPRQQRLRGASNERSGANPRRTFLSTRW